VISTPTASRSACTGPRPRTTCPSSSTSTAADWTIGSVDVYDTLTRGLANAAHAIVVSVDYRLAPEHPYPEPLDDCWTAFDWVASNTSVFEGDPSRIAVAGDSAGGNLAAVVALMARDAGMRLAMQALIYPVTDASMRSQSYVDNGEGYLLEAKQMRWFVDCYRRGGADVADWHISPLRAPDVAGVAPALVITAEYDPLRDEGEAYAKRLADAGVPVELTRYDGMIHAFCALPAVLDDGKVAMQQVARGPAEGVPLGMAVLDVAGFVADLKDHAVEHGFHVHDERHFVESYSLRQTWEVDVHPEEGCEGPVDLYLSMEIDPRVLLGFEDAVINLPDDDEPEDAFHFPLNFTWALPPLPQGPDLLVLATELAGIGGPELPLEVSATDSFPSATDAPERTLRIVAHQSVSLLGIRRAEEVPCETLERCLAVSRYLLDHAADWLG
jgi:acetyl esterase/lipase